jgi:phage gp29-like protein
MTSDDGSSMAQAEVHDGVRHDIAAADARQVTGTINRDLVRAYVDLNFGVQDRYPRITIPVAEPDDTEGRVKSAVSMAEAGVPLKASEVRALGGFSDPEKGDEIVGGKPVAPRPDATAPFAMNRAAPGGSDEADELAEIRDEMLADWRPVMAETLDPVIDAIDGADSYEDALARLDALPGMDSALLIDTLVRGLFKARALGDVRDV